MHKLTLTLVTSFKYVVHMHDWSACVCEPKPGPADLWERVREVEISKQSQTVPVQERISNSLLGSCSVTNTGVC